MARSKLELGCGLVRKGKIDGWITQERWIGLLSCMHGYDCVTGCIFIPHTNVWWVGVSLLPSVMFIYVACSHGFYREPCSSTVCAVSWRWKSLLLAQIRVHYFFSGHFWKSIKGISTSNNSHHPRIKDDTTQNPTMPFVFKTQQFQDQSSSAIKTSQKDAGGRRSLHFRYTASDIWEV